MNPEQRYQNKKDRRRPQVDLTTMVYGKVPPQAKDAESAVLGAIMLERDAFDIASEILKSECFYINANQIIFTTFCELQKAGQPIDSITVAMHLIQSGNLENVGGPYYLTNLTKAVVSSANIEHHCLAVLQTFMQREMIRISGQTISDAYDDKDVFELISDHEKSLTELTTGSLKKTYSPIDVEVVQALARIESLQNQSADITGVPTGFAPLDHVTYGWQNTDLIILAARPAVGKTALALNLATSAARSGKGVAFFSLEMSKGQLVERWLSSESEVWLEKLKRGKLETNEYEKVFNETAPKLSQLPIYIDDTAALTILDLRSRCRRIFRKHGIGLVVIDYLQLMSGAGKGGGNREQEISTISRGLKQLAKELNIPIIALSQLNRGVESRKGESKMPQLSDLRESGAIEQDADMVMFMYRPEYYDVNSNEMGESTKGETHIRIAKHRNGSLETIKLRALLHIQKFVEMEDIPATLPTGQGQKWAPVRNFYEPEEKDKDLPF